MSYSYSPIDTHDLLRDHYAKIQQNWWQAMAATNFDLVIVHAGQNQLFFEDDHGPAFKANPHLLQWVPPQYAVAESCLLISPGAKTQLLFFNQATIGTRYRCHRTI